MYVYGCYIVVLGQKNTKLRWMRSSMCLQEKAVLLRLETTWVSVFPTVSKHMKNLKHSASSRLGAEPCNKGQPMLMPAGM